MPLICDGGAQPAGVVTALGAANVFADQLGIAGGSAPLGEKYAATAEEDSVRNHDVLILA